ncbi:hypothetical protein N476_05325 [Pseudoalteromonas luteoviolacea H33]|uniref:Uncharacterized protein n=1 Tax=Pseudoalteromonas luteoviolacea H33 TaxID=1365251 RepID=A0A166ZKY0_9GAMM|nr:hypothetical protein N476_05325 [Pseudoalteromonas luteoviolacea H33]KZN78435.1 hypothetical protein N477_08515 [Pseudoalteromonas luteoviolacea H33-S]
MLCEQFKVRNVEVVIICDDLYEKEWFIKWFKKHKSATIRALYDTNEKPP